MKGFKYSIQRPKGHKNKIGGSVKHSAKQNASPCTWKREVQRAGCEQDVSKMLKGRGE